ncbi:Insulin-like growth factor binding protein, N-terminal [Pseudocohnilembus persalinus]|uniref:Insulin-like growth factor binding protein, N-terminal n=1 Tax=Pseudocohnilembus persalinus TaxID=266149 RepID=A0A0V0R9L5_PSEPJ|nr:Insulin-like growth factor binding protein, N-terminal [Pseudocohnilembus persalinus]|eukprot:KRX11169.1 Insulin-like growth factor binding protein, N-terminal [Pseudocohnilembus persalinus]
MCKPIVTQPIDLAQGSESSKFLLRSKQNSFKFLRYLFIKSLPLFIEILAASPSSASEIPKVSIFFIFSANGLIVSFTDQANLSLEYIQQNGENSLPKNVEGCSSGLLLQNKCRCLKGYGGKTCQLKCQSGEYVYEDNGNSVCINTGCPYGYYLDTNQYQDNDVSTCLECYKGCSECTNSKSDQCTACLSGYTLDSGKCKINCLSNSNCLECDGNDHCIECQIGYLLQSNECKLECDDGFYKKNGACLQCPLELNCQTCEYDNVNSKVVCLSCIQGQVSSLDVFFILKDNVCIDKCPDGYYKNTKGQCILCDSNCATCDGPYNHDCLSCRSDRKFHQNTCLNNCPEGFSQVAGKCTRITCYDKDYERVRNGECVYEQCYEYQYVYKSGIDTYCNNCAYNCKTCVDFPDKCTSCKDSDEELIDNKCYSKQKLKDRQVQDTQQLSESKQSKQLSQIFAAQFFNERITMQHVGGLNTGPKINCGYFSKNGHIQLGQNDVLILLTSSNNGLQPLFYAQLISIIITDHLFFLSM